MGDGEQIPPNKALHRTGYRRRFAPAFASRRARSLAAEKRIRDGNGEHHQAFRGWPLRGSRSYRVVASSVGQHGISRRVRKSALVRGTAYLLARRLLLSRGPAFGILSPQPFSRERRLGGSRENPSEGFDHELAPNVSSGRQTSPIPPDPRGFRAGSELGREPDARDMEIRRDCVHGSARRLKRALASTGSVASYRGEEMRAI